MSTRIRVEMRSVNAIVDRLGAGRSGAVQQFITNTVDRRITRYMPFHSGVLATKLKLVKSPTEIEVLGPYARYQYYGRVMAGSAPRTATALPLRYDRSKHPRAGPFWDRRLMAAEGRQIAAEAQKYVDRRAGKQ